MEFLVPRLGNINGVLISRCIMNCACDWCRSNHPVLRRSPALPPGAAAAPHPAPPAPCHLQLLFRRHQHHHRFRRYPLTTSKGRIPTRFHNVRTIPPNGLSEKIRLSHSSLRGGPSGRSPRRAPGGLWVTGRRMT